MKITLTDIGRRFNRDWILRGVSYTFQQGESYAILGANGSGKSTLLQLIAGSLTPTEGIIEVQVNGVPCDPDEVYQSLSLAAPYLELIEEFTLSEMIDFHFRFKAYKDNLNKEGLIALLNLEGSRNKALKYFSSGMKQRTKLALAILADTPVLLLDEPASNLDAQAIVWYQELIKKYMSDRIVIVCSNQEHEYSFCRNQIQVADYK